MMLTQKSRIQKPFNMSRIQKPFNMNSTPTHEANEFSDDPT